ncbi:hypothetical protein ACFYR1_49825 [Streptomyces canus]|uniref:hypothetical protein n=1 Tax=Streptomyces canus TaxID=58343 RepID=UPI00369BA12F
MPKVVAIREFALEPGETEQIRDRLRATEGMYQQREPARGVSATALDLEGVRDFLPLGGKHRALDGTRVALAMLTSLASAPEWEPGTREKVGA